MPEPAARLFLVTPVLTEVEPFLDDLRAALAAGDVACVLARLRLPDERSAKAALRRLAGVVQAGGAALLAEDDPRLAAHADADGVHIGHFGPALEDALERLKPERIVGCGGFTSRHDAMTAGESDLDYVMFGEPDENGAPPAHATRDWIEWWAPIFNVPCVGFAGALSEVESLAAAGADFVALGEALWRDERGAAEAMADAMARLRAGVAAAQEAGA